MAEVAEGDGKVTESGVSERAAPRKERQGGSQATGRRPTLPRKVGPPPFSTSTPAPRPRPAPDVKQSEVH